MSSTGQNRENTTLFLTTVACAAAATILLGNTFASSLWTLTKPSVTQGSVVTSSAFTSASQTDRRVLTVLQASGERQLLAQQSTSPSQKVPQGWAFATTALGSMAIMLGVYLKNRRNLGEADSWEQAEIAIATVTGEASNETKRIPGIKPRPAGYKHDVTRGYQLEEVSRPRRNRRHPAIRSFMRETQMSPANFIMPLFIHDEDYDSPINAMPGCKRLCAASVLREIGECVEQGVNMFILFPKVSDDLKTPDGRQCYDPTDIVMRTLKLIKGAYPDVVVCTDIALDPYNTDGHDGIVDETTGVILNDITVEQLCKQALAQARAGTDIVAPSDMQDGRIGAIRDALDGEGFTHVGIMSYCAKYASAFYGPFREALDSNPSFGDKATYQMDPANRREALREIELDEAEGADILMVKPAIAYLDVIMTLKENSSLPIAAYQVSGEYSMIKAAAQQGFIDEQKVVLESLLSIRRAGADVILTYFAKDAAKWMNDPNGWWQKKMTGKI